MGGYFACGCVLLYSLIGYLTGIGSSLGFSWNVEALGFIYGFLLADIRILNCVKMKIRDHTVLIYTLSIAASLLLGIAYLKFKYVEFFGEYLLRTLLGIAIISFVLVITYRVRIGNVAIRFIGKISYEVFLIHGFVMSCLSAVNERITGLSSGVFIALTFAFTMVLAYLFHMMNSRIIRFVRGTGNASR